MNIVESNGAAALIPHLRADTAISLRVILREGICKMKRAFIRQTSLILCLLMLLSAVSLAFPASASAEGSAFRYNHDPRLNPVAMEDVIVDPEAVYGFSPSPNGSLAAYAGFDWTDPEAVASYKQNRLEYFYSYSQMYDMLDEMTAEGRSTEEIARAVSTKHNELRIASYDGNPEGLAALKQRNLEKYGHEDGPTPDELYEKYGSWEIVIEKAFTHNCGMDACVGLYDDYYDYYIAFGYIEDESVAPVSREYAISAFMQVIGSDGVADGDILTAFSDADEVGELYFADMAQAVKVDIVKGYEDGTLCPQRTLTRVEAFVLLARCLPELNDVRGAIEFTDVPNWARADIDRLSRAGLVEGYGGGVLGARDELTVKQLKILIARADENLSQSVSDGDIAA